MSQAWDFTVFSSGEEKSKKIIKKVLTFISVFDIIFKSPREIRRRFAEVSELADEQD